MYKKYNNQKTIIDGQKFDSKKEAARFKELYILQRQGYIKNLQLQVKFELIPKQKGEHACFYIADFVYTDNETGKTIVEDVKGMRTEVYKIKKKLMLYFYGIHITEI